MNRNKIFVFVLFSLCILFVNQITFGAIIHVPADQATIQAGIDAAKDGDTVLVSDGVYKGEGNVNINFKGKQITLKSQNGATETIIDCEGRSDTRGFTFQNNEKSNSVIHGFTIKNGTHIDGGGIYCKFASPTIKKCIITENSPGGGIYCDNSGAIIEGCTISNNALNTWYGGSIYLTGEWIGQPSREKVSIVNCTISDNTGNGIVSTGYITVEIIGCTVSNNSRVGIECLASYSNHINLIAKSIIEKNQLGGIGVRENTLVKITESVIRDNTGEGGIFCSRTSSIDISECIIANNKANRFGGGIYVHAMLGYANISHTIITGNSAGLYGGGIYGTVSSNLTLTNSIVWGNSSDGTHDEVYASGKKIVIQSCDIKGGINGLQRIADGVDLIYEDNINKDPLFVDVDRGDYRLRRNSPALGMGPQTNVGGALSIVPLGKRLVMWADMKRK
ncbi:MAG: right-handed parallel beta-helix repeat-containing protein [Candidatus Poribacteria bacterium]|nr:right-handed parallel beta-helix repeat-containing protein [Candidatus Poribacteria bacterium]